MLSLDWGALICILNASVHALSQNKDAVTRFVVCLVLGPIIAADCCVASSCPVFAERDNLGDKTDELCQNDSQHFFDLQSKKSKKPLNFLRLLQTDQRMNWFFICSKVNNKDLRRIRKSQSYELTNGKLICDGVKWRAKSWPTEVYLGPSHEVEFLARCQGMGNPLVLWVVRM